jgi:pimeloyl-ACP methyl ester carboxylesterase
MRTTRSKDGTTIAFDQAGNGPALILIGGALSNRAAAVTLMPRLASHFTVFAFDRRGRGDSGDTSPYAVEREIEDIAALISEAGGSASLFGHSSGAVLALEAARQLPSQITKLALYEPPFIIDDSRPPLSAAFDARLTDLVASGQRSEAVEYFLGEGVQVPAEMLAQMKASPMWPELVTAAHTLPYDVAMMGDTESGNPEALAKFAAIAVPTLVMDGGASPVFMHRGAEALASVIPHARHQRLAGQQHGPADAVLVPALVEFFTA